MKLADAVQAAGGFTEFAGRSRIEILHIDGTFRTYNFNNQNPALRPGDVVHIIGSLD